MENEGDRPTTSDAPPIASSDEAEEPRTATARHLRGSSMLLVGRVASIGLNLASQVLVVRYLSKSDFGVFAYATSIVSFVQILVSLGQERNLTRFFSIYDEEGRYRHLFGTIALYVSTVTVMSVLAVAVMAVVSSGLTESLDNDNARTVLLIMTALAPIDAFDKLFEAQFAVFSRPRAIFVRKYLLQPVIKLGIVGMLILGEQSVIFLAVGFVAAGLLGLLLYGVQIPRVLRERNLLVHARIRGLVWPYKEIFGFSLPLLTTELVYLSMNTVSVVLLGYFDDAAAVASFRAIFPFARFNQLVFFSFSLLFLPLAARLFARKDLAGLRDAYWQTATWLAVLSFPIVAVTTALAEPTTTAMLGPGYAESAPYLALLSLGFYVNVAFGFNYQVLQVVGRVRWIVAVNVTAAVLNVVLSVALIPPLGPMGIAIANATTLLAQNFLNQLGLARCTPLGFIDASSRKPYLSIAASLVGLAVLQQTLDPPLVVGATVSVVLGLMILRLNRRSLRISQTFPEVSRLPLIGRLIG